MKIFRLACWLWGCLFLALGSSYAQRLDHVQGELIIELTPGRSIDHFLESFHFDTTSTANLQLEKALYEEANLWLLGFDHNKIHADQLLSSLRNHPNVVSVQFNHLLAARSTIPNDPLFDLQWNWLNQNPPLLSGGDIDLDLAWDLTQGGLTTEGDTIVIALIDDGIDPDHPDLCGNLWKNQWEIPNNGIDEDGNGYVDDHLGWNVSAEMDLVEYGSHGVKVAGILGARGNNQKGISGLNWQVKIMPIVGIAQSESEIIAGMVYALKMRQLYQATAGAKGAFVVVANFSWGMDGGFPEDAPIWCSFFDLLGESGILSCAATTNHNWDISQSGDLPTTCPSEYLISVTVSDKQDQRPFGGYHPDHIDLAAPGKQVLTTSAGNAYALASGTSFAAPHVSGLAALLYASSCNTLGEAAQSDPALTALWIKDLLLQGADQLPHLSDQVALGRRLNAFQSLQLLESNCNACPPPVAIALAVVTEQSALIEWETANDQSCKLRWRPVGLNSWYEVEDVQPPFLLTTLSNCQEYEIQIQVQCQQGTSNYSSSYFFKTSGCCMPPDISISQVSEQAISFKWENPGEAGFYTLSYKPFESLEWESLEINETIFTLNGLEACTNYVFQFTAHCANGFTSAPGVQTVLTAACDACHPHLYCQSQGSSSADEWIASIRLGSFEYYSGNNNGYGDFTGNPITVVQNQPVFLEIKPGFSGTVFPETYAVWADLNLDGLFDPVSERLAASTTGIHGPFHCVLDFSAIQQPTILALRIQMRWGGLENTEPCGDFSYGEVEDYCLQILPANQLAPCDFSPIPEVLYRSSNTVGIRWGPNDHTGSYLLRWKPLQDVEWKEIYTERPTYELTNLESCASFEWMVRKICMQDTTPFSARYAFSTDCPENTIAQPTAPFQAFLFPNPSVQEAVTLRLQGIKATSIYCRLFSADSRIIWEANIHPRTHGSNEYILHIPPHLPAGLYMLSVRTNDRLFSKKIIRQ